MLTFSSCKINLGLFILNKRPDHFHSIETVFYPIHFLQDAIEIISNSSFKDLYYFTGIEMDCKEDENLGVKTINLLREYYDFPFITLYLHKAVPMGAGLGGGSANVASIINLINEKYHLEISKDFRRELASQIGSDCAFFIDPIPSFGEEKGEILSKVDISLSGYYLLIVKPPIHISTALAYKNTIPQSNRKTLKEIILNTKISSWKEVLQNDFETGIFKEYLEIAKIKETLYQSGAIYAQMSGSGSAVFGIFDKKIEIPFPNNYTNYWGII